MKSRGPPRCQTVGRNAFHPIDFVENAQVVRVHRHKRGIKARQTSISVHGSDSSMLRSARFAACRCARCRAFIARDNARLRSRAVPWRMDYFNVTRLYSMSVGEGEAPRQRFASGGSITQAGGVQAKQVARKCGSSARRGKGAKRRCWC